MCGQVEERERICWWNVFLWDFVCIWVMVSRTLFCGKWEVGGVCACRSVVWAWWGCHCERIRCELGLLLVHVRDLKGLLLGFWVLGFKMWRVIVVYRGSWGMWFSGLRDRVNTEGSDHEGITRSSCCNQEDVHCRSDMRQSSVC
jgi:hypothetical protein